MDQVEKPAKEYPKYITVRMRCGRTIVILDTPAARENIKRMRWTIVAR